MVHEDVLAAARVHEDRLPARRVDVPVRREDERSAGVEQVDSVLVHEWAVCGL